MIIDEIVSFSRLPESTKETIISFSLKLFIAGSVYDSGSTEVNERELSFKKKLLPEIASGLLGNVTEHKVLIDYISTLNPNTKDNQFSAAYALNEIFYQLIEDNDSVTDLVNLIQKFRIELLINIALFSASTLDLPNEKYYYYIAGLGSLFEVTQEGVNNIIEQSFSNRD